MPPPPQPDESAVLWRPGAKRCREANLTRFIEFVNARYDLSLRHYAQLYEWSIHDSPKFWTAVAAFTQVIAHWGSAAPLQDAGSMPGARWFGDTRLNFAENLLARPDDRPAIVFVNERGQRRELSRSRLRDEVARIASGLREAGVCKGDRVAGFMPNLPEAVVAMLAATSLGAIWSSCSPDFGAQSVLDRFGPLAPKVLFTADGYYYGGKCFDSLARATKVAEGLPSVRRVVVVPYLSEAPCTSELAHGVLYGDFGANSGELHFESTDFDHPVYVLFSSGTTGLPKCIVHGAGGTLLQHRKEHVLHTDLKPGDRLFYFTTCGWMMWNWLVSALASEATIVLYDGSPLTPSPRVLWEMAEREQVAIFGASAGYFQAIEKHNFKPRHEVTLPALRTILSTGSPLSSQSFDFIYREIKWDLLLSSISGGTDIISCFALGNPLLPVRRGELQCRGLGMRVEIYDDQGNSIRGGKGELVCTAPFPSMPLGFWGDADGQRYLGTYFQRFPGVWHHGDYAALTEADGIVIYGRSDTVLNPAGVRIGTAEIYRAVNGLEEVTESVAVAQEWDGDVRIVLFVRLRQGLVLDQVLRDKIRNKLRTETSPKHVPAKILAVADIPRTMSGKLAELAVRSAVHGKPVENLSALANPEALRCFTGRADVLEP